MAATVQMTLIAALLAGCSTSPTADGPPDEAAGPGDARRPPVAVVPPPALDPPASHDPTPSVDLDDPVAVATRQVADGLAAEGLETVALDAAVTGQTALQVQVTVMATHTAGIGHPHQGRYLLVLEPAATGWRTARFDEAG